MANKNWGQKRLCEESGKKFYDFNKKPIISPFTGQELIFEDINLKAPVVLPKPEPKKADELANIDDAPDDSSDNDIISLDDQKEIEDSNEEVKID